MTQKSSLYDFHTGLRGAPADSSTQRVEDDELMMQTQRCNDNNDGDGDDGDEETTTSSDVM
jgi:hypothetical protein